MINSFADEATEDLYHGRDTGRVRRFPVALRGVALRKLDMIEAAQSLEDLRQPPGNHLEALHGPLMGYHSIRVNDQWRLVFRWVIGYAHDLALTDYHS